LVSCQLKLIDLLEGIFVGQRRMIVRNSALGFAVRKLSWPE